MCLTKPQELIATQVTLNTVRGDHEKAAFMLSTIAQNNSMYDPVKGSCTESPTINAIQSSGVTSVRD